MTASARRAASGSASPAWTSSATTTAGGSCSRTTSARRAASPTCTPRAVRSRAHRRPARGDAAPARRRDRPAHRRAARRRPESARGRRAPTAAVLTDGEQNSAYGSTLALPSGRHPADHRGRARGARQHALAARPGLREPRRIDVIYRRTNADRLDSDIGRLLIEPVRSGRSAWSTSTGPGSPTTSSPRLRRADDPLLRRRGAVLRSVPTYDLAQPRSSRRRWTSSTSSCSSRGPGTAVSAC